MADKNLTQNLPKKLKRKTCMVKSCKVTLNLNGLGFCVKHVKKGISNDLLYDSCRECSYLVKVGEPGVTCDKCEIWYHVECVGISEDEYRCMLKDANLASPKFHWYCRFCKQKCIEAVSKVDLLETQTRNLATKVEKLSERVNTIESSMSKSVKENVRSSLDERADIERRKHNLIVLNMAESNIDGASAWYTAKKKEADLALFSEIAESSLDIEASLLNITDNVRLGAKRNDGKPRPLKVTFRDMNIKREVLGKAKLLRNTRHRNIYINPDLTPEQRKADSELRKHLKNRRNEGETDIYISKGKIVKSSPPKKLIEEIEEDIPPLAPEIESDSSSESSSDDDIYSDVTDTEDETVTEGEEDTVIEKTKEIEEIVIDNIDNDSVEMKETVNISEKEPKDQQQELNTTVNNEENEETATKEKTTDTVDILEDQPDKIQHGRKQQRANKPTRKLRSKTSTSNTQ